MALWMDFLEKGADWAERRAVVRRVRRMDRRIAGLMTIKFKLSFC
jgi:hypothetical protein